MSIDWNKDAQDKFDQMIAKVPGPMQEMAKDAVNKKAVEIVETDGRNEIVEKDLVDAMFEVTPFGFHGPMKSDMESLGIDYKQYGHE